MKLKILLIVLSFLVIIQFFTIDKTNPGFNEEHDMLTITQTPVEMSTLIKASCYDCHSNQSKYPWYSNIAPVSWWLKHHIDEGREHLNFSDWASYTPKKANHKFEECIEMLEAGDMPLWSYTLTHKEARLSDKNRLAMTAWFKELYEKPNDMELSSGEEETVEDEQLE